MDDERAVSYHGEAFWQGIVSIRGRDVVNDYFVQSRAIVRLRTCFTQCRLVDVAIYLHQLH